VWFIHGFRKFYPYLEKIESVKEAKFEFKQVREVSQLLDILRAAICHQLLELNERLNNDDGISFDEKWNKLHQVEVANVSLMHALYMTSSVFNQGINQLNMKKENIIAMTLLCKIFLCESIIKHGEYALMKDYITSDHMTQINGYFYELIEEFRPFLIPFSESPVITENMLQGSLLGDLTDDYCSNMYEAAKFSHLNAFDKLDTIDSHLKPLSKKLSNFSRL
jgi:hypothetical protein